MAISCLEQRYMPLVNSVPFWKPWGPGLVAPALFQEDQEDPEEVILHTSRKLTRSRSWAGYATYSLLESNSTSVVNHHQNSAKLKQQLVGGAQVKKSLEPTKPTPQGNVKSKSWKDHRPVAIHAVQPAIHTSTVNTDMFTNAKSPKSPQSSKSPKSPESSKSPKSSQSLKSRRGRKHNKSNNGDISPGGHSGCSSPGGSPVVCGPITTLMIRNLPHNVTHEELFGEVDNCGYAGLYDFCYMPHRFTKHKNLGFAFLNFVTEDTAATFRQQWHLVRRFGATLNISTAAVQGRKANEEAANSPKMCRVRNPCYKPMVFEGPNGSQASSLSSSESSSESSNLLPCTPKRHWEGSQAVAVAA